MIRFTSLWSKSAATDGGHGSLRAIAAMAVLLLASSVAFASAPKALINGDTVSGSPSQEQQIAAAQGFQVTVVSGSTWDAMSADDFGQYDVLILGDPFCRAIANSALANINVWAPVVMGTAGGRTQAGNRILIGTDPVLHDGGAGTSRAEVIRSGIAFAGKQPGRTGLYFDATCTGYYGGGPGLLAALNVLKTGTGSWSINLNPPCGGGVAVIASNPAFATLTSASLQGWGCSVHETFPAYPSDWTPLAVATDTPSHPTCGTDPSTGATACGESYILIAGSAIVVTAPNIAVAPTEAKEATASNHSMTATLSRAGAPVTGQLVTFTVTGVNVGASGTCSPADCTTDSSGTVTFTYHDLHGPGDDTVSASFIDGGSKQQASSIVHWEGPRNQPPVALCRDVTLAVGNSCTAAIAPSDVDNGSSDPDAGDTITLGISPSGSLGVGTHSITLTAADSYGATSSCSATATVVDNTAPLVNTPANQTVSTDAGVCGATVAVGSATATDNCAVDSIAGVRSDGQALNASYPLGTTTITWTATDASGNHASSTQTIIVKDTEAPVITAPASKTVSSDAHTCAASVDPGSASATDNCTVASVAGVRSDGQALNAPYPLGTTTITWTATDASGNHASATQTVTVKDTEAPAITAPASRTVSNDPHICGASVNPGTASATDNCAVASVVGVRSDGQPLNALYPLGTTTIVWTATDPSGNSSSASQTVTVNDVEPPSISGASLSMTQLWPVNHKMVDVTVSYTTSDNCDPIVTTSLSIASNESTNALGDGNSSADWQVVDNHHIRLRAERSGTSNGRTYTVTITATDSKGNTSTQMLTCVVPKSM